MALAAIDRSQNVTFSETPYPTLTGDFEIITCTQGIQFNPAADQQRFLACGYNPAAQTIPGKSVPGSLSFEGLDRATENRAMAYNGVLSVARLITRIDDVVVRTIYCNYYTPLITVTAPQGEQVGTVSGTGPFAYNVTA